jgi:hypothetical protein
MEWIQVLTIIGVLGGFTLWHAARVDNEIKEIRETNKDTNRRVDQLYMMFCDLLKEQRK